jgi:hypothetical protein
MRAESRRGGVVVGLALGALLAVGSCASDRGATVADGADASTSAGQPLAGSSGVLAESPDARVRVEELRARFAITPAAPTPTPMHALDPAGVRSVIRAGVGASFEADGSHVRAVVPASAKRAVLRAATVSLPMRASGDVLLEDDTTHVAVKFHLRGASDAKVAVTNGIAVYRGALPGGRAGSDVVHRVHAEGTEDYVVFEARPAVEEIAYDVDVSRVAGLRLVSNVLEFLDAGGAPRLRVAEPDSLT